MTKITIHKYHFGRDSCWSKGLLGNVLFTSHTRLPINKKKTLKPISLPELFNTKFSLLLKTSQWCLSLKCDEYNFLLSLLQISTCDFRGQWWAAALHLTKPMFECLIPFSFHSPHTYVKHKLPNTVNHQSPVLLLRKNLFRDLREAGQTMLCT